MSVIRKTVRSLKNDGLFTTLQNVYSFCWHKLFKNYRHFNVLTESRHYIHKIQHDAPADPYQVIWINPEKPDFASTAGKPWRGLGQIGEWENSKWELDDVKTYRSVKQRFEENCNWEDTVIYNKAKQDFQNGLEFEGYDTLEQFRRERCGYVDSLFDSMESNGYVPMNSREFDVPDADIRANTRKSVHRLEPLVVIDADGSIYWRDGFHRIAIAEILEIDSIPVNVLLRHRDWQKIRDEMYNAQSCSELSDRLKKYLGHPDLHDIV